MRDWMLKVTLVVSLFTSYGVMGDEGYFWHVTDHHYDTTYWSEHRSCNDKVPVRGIYGDYWCDSPWRLVNDSIVAMAKYKKNVDFIIWTGDNVAHIQNKFLNVSQNLAMIGKITDVLKTQFPGVTVYATMGNHDYYPADQFPGHSSALYNATADLWSEWINQDQQLQNFKKGAFYTLKLNQILRIVGLNTNLYYNVNNATATEEDPAGQFEWLQQTLNTARNNSEKVILTGHIPPGIKVPGKVLWFREVFNKRFLDIIQTFADIIPAMYFGHDHADEFKLLQKYGGGPGIPMFMAPSVTPWRYKTPTETADPHNPAIRLIKYDTGTGVALDYSQYYLDLPASNHGNKSIWKLGYSAINAYKVDDLSAVSVDNIIKKMSKEDTYLDDYIRFNTVLANANDTVNRCDGTCRAEFLCAFTNHEKGKLNTCIDAQLGGAARVSTTISLLMVVLTVLYLL